MSAIKFWSLPARRARHNVEDMELKGKRALVTGGSRGIGAAIARQLLDAGAVVLTTARSATSTIPEGAVFIEGDVRTKEGTQAIADAAIKEFGGVDILVNNAGAGRPYPEGVLAIPDEEWQDSLDINFLSSVRLDAALLPQMKQNGEGAIIHISSSVTLAPGAVFLHYAAAKAALETYSRGLALEVAASGIRVNAIIPGNVRTPGADVARDVMSGGAFEIQNPLGRIGEPDDIANIVSFLVSDKASWITGRRFTVDGGEFPLG
jgi:NAD(P)-dependent dehydrogenase (short-subunit alcohol dehydrogenase family)